MSESALSHHLSSTSCFDVATAPELVSNWGLCDGCSCLVNLTLPCENCAEEAARKRILGASCIGCGARVDREGYLCPDCADIDRLDADSPERHVREAVLRVQLRPCAVRVVPEGVDLDEDPEWSEPDVAILRVPVNAPRCLTRTAVAVARVATRKLEIGWTLDYTVRGLAAGRDVITAELAAMGHVRDRKSVASDLEHLCRLGVLERVGQLDEWADHSAPNTMDDPVQKSGAYKYALNVAFRGLGDLFTRAVGALSLYGAGSGVIEGLSRIRACLRGATQNAYHGSRNHGGYWLARRCTEVGLCESDAEKWMGLYQKAVQDLGRPTYTDRVAMRTLASAYRLHAQGSARA